MSPEERAYRDEARAWLLANTEPRQESAGFESIYWMRDVGQVEAHHRRSQALHRKLHDAGYVAITYPKAAGGQGGEPWMQRAFNEESFDRDVSTGFYGSIMGMAAPALMKFGSDAQIAQHCGGLVSGEVSWCQLFSEPGAGSDLAGLATSAVLDGDEYVLNGQKVWNSAAMFAEMGILLTRTDPDAVKHQGITFFLVPMDQPGVEVRPLVQANGAAHFAEVFFDDARVPAANVLGAVNEGWGPARMVLANESATIGGHRHDRLGMLMRLAEATGRTTEPVIRQRLADGYIRQRCLDLMSDRISAALRAGQPMPIDPSIVKLMVADNTRRFGELATELLGPSGVADTHEASVWAMELLHMRYSISIGGGTNEVHRNNLGERALGLPRDVRVDKDIPWRDVPRG